MSNNKPNFKDAQLSLRMNSDLLQAMKSEAQELNISLADFVVRLYEAYKNDADIRPRLEALEKAVFFTKAQSRLTPN